MRPLTIKQVSAAVTTITFTDISAGWDQWIMLSSDRHHDSPLCDRELEKKHLEKAKEREALILDFGDLFDAMQGHFDPRRNMDEVRPEDAGINYYDRIVDHAIEDYSPYAANIALVSSGNHETAVVKHTNHDLVAPLVHGLNRAGGRVIHGGYGGWVKLHFHVNKTKRSCLNLKYFHGAGGGGPVTRGVIQTNRQSVYLPDADVVVNGHTHDAWVMPIARERLNTRGFVHRDLIWFARTPGYKNEYGDGTKGYQVERWAPPKPLGCCWLHLTCDDGRYGMITSEIIAEVS